MRTPRLIPRMLHGTVDSLCQANHGFAKAAQDRCPRRGPGGGCAGIGSDRELHRTDGHKLMLSGNWRLEGYRTYGAGMYRYDSVDKTLVSERVAQFRDQTRRFLAGELSDDDFRHLRLRNGLYIQRHAPMLRVAIPYGLLSSKQLRTLASIARRYDRGYGHFTTRQNIQYNWPRIEDVPDILAELADVEMHAIQTSGNCIRNVTSDPLAGVVPDELEDPRPWCEIIRQWSTFHPEFTYLPRKFKIAVTGSPRDRAGAERRAGIRDPRRRRARPHTGDRPSREGFPAPGASALLSRGDSA